MSYLYVDASTLVSIALDDPERSKSALGMFAGFERVGTSELSTVECQAGLCQELRTRPDLWVDAEQNLNQIFSQLQILGVVSSVLSRARSLVKRYRASIGLRSADAIHVATANVVKDVLAERGIHKIEFLTSDRKQYEAFTAEGYTGTFLA